MMGGAQIASSLKLYVILICTCRLDYSINTVTDTDSNNYTVYSRVSMATRTTPEPVKIGVPADSVTPTEAWDRRKVKQTVKIVKPQSHSQKKKDGHTRFVCISGMLLVLKSHQHI